MTATSDTSEPTRSAGRLQRRMAASCGALFTLGILIGDDTINGAGEPPAPMDRPDDSLAEAERYLANADEAIGSYWVGRGMGTLALIALLVFSVYVAREVRLREKNVQIAKETYEAFARGDLPGVLGSFHQDVEWHAAEGLPWGRRPQGSRCRAQDVFGALMTAFDGFSLTHEVFIDGGDFVVALGRYHATATQTGKPLDAAFAHVWELEDGKLKRYFHYTDTVKFEEALS